MLPQGQDVEKERIREEEHHSGAGMEVQAVLTVLGNGHGGALL